MDSRADGAAEKPGKRKRSAEDRRTAREDDETEDEWIEFAMMEAEITKNDEFHL